MEKNKITLKDLKLEAEKLKFLMKATETGLIALDKNISQCKSLISEIEKNMYEGK